MKNFGGDSDAHTEQPHGANNVCRQIYVTTAHRDLYVEGRQGRLCNSDDPPIHRKQHGAKRSTRTDKTNRCDSTLQGSHMVKVAKSFGDVLIAQRRAVLGLPWEAVSLNGGPTLAPLTGRKGTQIGRFTFPFYRFRGIRSNRRDSRKSLSSLHDPETCACSDL